MTAGPIVTGIHAVAGALREAPNRVVRVFVQEAAKPNRRRDDVVAQARESGVEIVMEEIAFFRKVASHGNPQGLAAELVPFGYAALEDLFESDAPFADIILVLDGVSDPHNLGSILRTAAFFGLAGVVIPRRRAAEVTPLVERVSAGGARVTKVARVPNLAGALETLKSRGFWVIGTVETGGEVLETCDLSGPIALVLGAEGTGLRELTQKRCDRLVTLPARGAVPALNVGVFSGMVLYESVRQRTVTVHPEPDAPSRKGTET